MAMDESTYLYILDEYWGYKSFRGIQQQIISSIGEGHDTLGLMPTGGGKSICFQVPTLAMDGMCLVITPLISLMKDQVMQLKLRGIPSAAIHTGMAADDVQRILDNSILGGYKFLYISPERLASDNFRVKLMQMKNICLITVDEAHCISQWGYDFRPSYLQIAEIRNIISYHVPVLALTATATPRVVEDIQDKLGFKEKRAFSMSFERKNLIYVVRETINKAEEMLHILKSVPQGSAIVYTRTRRLTSEISQYLRDNDITADSYHAGLTEAEKDMRQRNWNANRNRVMVATNAFGMGIDKPDVRVVIHYNMPDSIEAYFQEAGRAGRDGQTSYAILLYNPKDSKILKKRVDETYPGKEYVIQTYENICYFFQVGVGEGQGRTFDFSMPLFCKAYKQFSVQTDSSLRLLDYAGYIEYNSENEFKSRLYFVTSKNDLYRINYNSELDNLICVILRLYTGVFAGFVYIDEMQLSHETGYPADKIYEMLKQLHRNRVIDYIPRRNTPTIKFITPRIDTERLYLPPSSYDQRKKEYVTRLRYIYEYASSTLRCRSRMLLHYFGEDDTEECGKCDVCTRRKRNGYSAEDINSTILLINKVLADGQPHPVSSLKALNVNHSLVKESLKAMADEDLLTIDQLSIQLKNKPSS